MQILVQHFQCWCYSYPMSTCLTANTLTSARATSVLTHLIKKAVAYNNLNSKVKNKRVTNGNLLSNELFFTFYYFATASLFLFFHIVFREHYSFNTFNYYMKYHHMNFLYSIWCFSRNNKFIITLTFKLSTIFSK